MSQTTTELKTEGVRARRAIASVRNQVALVRALTDEVEHLIPCSAPGVASGRLIEELARLGCRILEAAAAMAGSSASEAEPYRRCGDAVQPTSGPSVDRHVT